MLYFKQFSGQKGLVNVFRYLRFGCIISGSNKMITNLGSDVFTSLDIRNNPPKFQGHSLCWSYWGCTVTSCDWLTCGTTILSNLFFSHILRFQIEGGRFNQPFAFIKFLENDYGLFAVLFHCSLMLSLPRFEKIWNLRVWILYRFQFTVFIT